MRELVTAHGAVATPAYLPDATNGVVRAVDAVDLETAGVEAVVMNVFHLMQKPGTATLQGLGGLHKMSGWNGPIITDSGGFQAYSLIRQNPKFGTLSDRGISFQPEGAIRKFQLSPEKSIQLQFSYGADVLICLDDCTNAESGPEVQRQAVERTVNWARRCRSEFDRLLAQRKKSDTPRPLIFGVVQGGDSHELRKECADRLLEIGFDGYGFGGWPLDDKNALLEESLAYTRSVIPAEFPMHALGVGHPNNVLACVKLGYDIFDSALPTRDARDGRIYTSATGRLEDTDFTAKWFSYLYIDDEKHIRSAGPLDEGCDCHTCSRWSLGYLRHLRKMNEMLYYRLATIHNLRFMMRLMARIRETTP